MAGGKETPRQKMIGMMYLVLTALLALNVSKSILDAFVAIEENTQKTNIVQVERGDGFYADVKSELASTKDDAENKTKREKLQYVLSQMDKINKVTGEMIKKIDDVKIDILKKSGENVDAVKDTDHETLMWKKYDTKDPVRPTRMWLMAVQAKDQYDVPMHEIVGEDIKNPTGSGKQLWADLINFRKQIVELTGTYQMPGSSKKFSISPKPINEYASNQDLTKKVEAMIKASQADVKEDFEALKELYIGLTKPEKNEVHDVKGVHWMGMTFDHSPLVAAVASLSSLQQDVLAARALALGHWKSKVSTGEYSFNKIMPLAYGPAVANNGDEVELQVMMAAFDSDNQPTVTVDMESAKVKYPGNGQGIVSFTASGSTTISGTVSIKNKSGVPKTEKWEHTVQIMKPQGSIELPELNVLYRGYANKVEATASGYPETRLTGSGVSVSKSGTGWVAKPGNGTKCFLIVSGVSADGKTVQLKKAPFRISKLPDPVLYWGNAKSGSKGSKSSNLLRAMYPPEIPLNAQFTVVQWTCFAPGLKGAPPKGPGGNISAARPLIQAVKPGTGLSFNATVRGPDGIARQIGGSWSL